MGQNLYQIKPDTAAGSVPMTMAPYFRMEYVRPQTLADTLAPYLPAGHSPVTLSGTPDYITLSGQDIIRGQIDLTTDVTGLLPGANINSITESQISDLQSYLTAEVDGSITNEGSLTVGAGSGTTSIINSNTSGSTGVTVTAGSGLSISEAGNVITLANTGVLDVTGDWTGTLDGFEGAVLNQNVYNTNGTLTGNRTVEADGNQLNINNVTQFRVGSPASDGVFLMGSAAFLIHVDGGSAFMSLNDVGFGTTEADIKAMNITLDAPDIILEDPLTLSTWDSILVRHPVTGEIQARLASTIAGSDSLGRNGTAGQIVFETATKAPNSSANLFWDNSSIELGIGTNAPGRKLHIVSNFNGGEGITVDNNHASGYASVLFLNDGAGSGGFFYNGSSQASYAGAGSMNVIQVSNAPATIGTSNTVRLWVAGNGNVAIGAAAPAASAKLDITGTTGGLLPPRMTGTQRDAISSPAEGLILFNTTTSKLQVRAGGAWVDLH